MWRARKSTSSFNPGHMNFPDTDQLTRRKRVLVRFVPTNSGVADGWTLTDTELRLYIAWLYHRHTYKEVVGTRALVEDNQGKFLRKFRKMY